jgi:hypothetical protein
LIYRFLLHHVSPISLRELLAAAFAAVLFGASLPGFLFGPADWAFI